MTDPRPVRPVRALDARYYTDPAIWDAERRGLLGRTWQFAGHASQLQNPGDYFTFEIAGESLFAILDRHGETRAFYNVCQHRAHRLVEGTGSCKVIVCPYHAWTYEHDGRLRAGPNLTAVEGFDRGEVRLTGVRIECFCGFLFANLDWDAAPMSDWYPGVAAELRGFVPQIDGLAPLEWVEVPGPRGYELSDRPLGSPCGGVRVVVPLADVLVPGLPWQRPEHLSLAARRG